MYKVEWKDQAKKDLKKLDRSMAKKIVYEVETHLVKNPTELGKPLTGDRKGQWRYRFSSYRVIYKIKEKELIILVLEAGHRREIY
ncbi:type II toxin-antitoxin system RelE family toxin [endosymbiont GvMRE of Glomus versiforme]|uniref:type II toxin-antitoxin system RelE family toxin n=1 Tax=endosymbiont GvMRE of Glomus versiforme TaxID=2039283 RepID=UPI001FE99610|nr:type II toxin-antitoxin system RelE/ParE family toxin [endosymbiont GvMRE of Glomus versiforme]